MATTKTKKTRPVQGKPGESRQSPKRAGSTAKPAAAGRYSTQLKKAPQGRLGVRWRQPPLFKAAAPPPHFHEKAIICQAGIGRATWRSIDAARHLSFVGRWSVVAITVVGPMNRAIHTSIRTLSGPARGPVHYEVRSVRELGLLSPNRPVPRHGLVRHRSHPPSSSRFTRPATPSRLSFHLSKIFTQLEVLTLLSGVPPAGCSVTARMSHR